jgi:hypothetical protein
VYLSEIHYGPRPQPGHAIEDSARRPLLITVQRTVIVRHRTVLVCAIVAGSNVIQVAVETKATLTHCLRQSTIEAIICIGWVWWKLVLVSIFPFAIMSDMNQIVLRDDEHRDPSKLRRRSTTLVKVKKPETIAPKEYVVKVCSNSRLVCVRRIR